MAFARCSDFLDKLSNIGLHVTFSGADHSVCFRASIKYRISVTQVCGSSTKPRTLGLKDHTIWTDTLRNLDES